MSKFMKLQDRFISWVEITGDNNVIHFATSSQEMAGTYDEITIEEGLYYCYKAESPPSGFPSLYSEIQSEMNALGSTLYNIRAYTKDNYPIRNRHIEIEKTNTSNLEPIQFLASSSFDLRYLGFTNTNPVFDPQDDSGITQSPYPYRGAWVPYTSVGLRSDKRSFESVDVSFSDEDTRRAYPLNKRRGRIRTFRWDYVDPYCIFESRAGHPDYEPHSRFANDTVGNNALDTWWNQWSSSSSSAQGSLSQGPIGLRPYLVTHDGGPNSGLRLTSGGSKAEVIIPSSQSEIANFEEIVSLRNVGGEFYDITFSCWVIDWEGVGGYDY